MTRDLLLDILFPKFCLGCGREGKYICERCNVFTSETQTLYFPQEKYGLDSLISIWEYEGIIKKAIHQIKYRGAFDIIKELMDIIDCRGDPCGRPNGIWRLLGQPQELPLQITFVPMYKKQERKRGFNQAKIIAEEIGKKVEAPCLPAGRRPLPLLKKTKDTKPQMELNQEERLENVKGCFEFVGAIHESPEMKRVIHELPLQNVLLVDDVYTTGATMNECARVLKKAGIKKVWGFTIARTV